LIVVDASMFVAWLLNEPAQRPEDAVWDLVASDTILVPSHWPNEVANALRRAVRMRRLRVKELQPIAAGIGALDISLAEPTAVHEISALATAALEHDVSAYDMAYLQLAREHRVPLATLDRGMRRAAGALNVRLLPA
jgi:predicted nucleic acid-binding protein